ncbi:MAG: hypothetical protein ABSG31_16560 [Tepidisphaeraceae bacterium]|jgi:hypothetical protein
MDSKPENSEEKNLHPLEYAPPRVKELVPVTGWRGIVAYAFIACLTILMLTVGIVCLLLGWDQMKVDGLKGMAIVPYIIGIAFIGGGIGLMASYKQWTRRGR